MKKQILKLKRFKDVQEMYEFNQFQVEPKGYDDNIQELTVRLIEDVKSFVKISFLCQKAGLKTPDVSSKMSRRHKFFYFKEKDYNNILDGVECVHEYIKKVLIKNNRLKKND